MKASEILKAALKKFGSKGQHWTKESYANDANGEVVMTTDPTAVCWCSVGAVCAVANGRPGGPKARTALAQAISDGSDLREGVVLRFNDRPLTTFKDVRRVFRKAIKMLEAA